jgi:hypothetical protein
VGRPDEVAADDNDVAGIADRQGGFEATCLCGGGPLGLAKKAKKAKCFVPERPLDSTT